MDKIVIIGAGGFATSLAVMLHRNAYAVTIWSSYADDIAKMSADRENKRLLPGIPIDEAITLTTDTACLQQASAVFFAVPSFALRSVCQSLEGCVSKEAMLVNVAKGFEKNTDKRLSVVLCEQFPHNRWVVLSGPSHAEEIANGVPTTMVAASNLRQNAEYVQDLLTSSDLRIYVSDDVIGVEIGGALKNIIALCAGICDGMELGDNTKAALMTRGLAEMARLGVLMGAKVETFAGLSGMGDLIVTAMSMHSRNRRAGIAIGKGMTASQAMEAIGMTVEGVFATQAAYRLSKQHKAEMPIVEQVYHVLYQNKDVRQALSDLMQRPKRHESETVWIHRR